MNEFVEMGGRVSLATTDGHHWEGYILEVEEHAIRFGDGGPLAREEPHEIELRVIDLSSLLFFDEKERKYKRAFWDEASGRWAITDGA